ncbi:MAG TPA: hypothetical protein VJ348_02905 [Candidatus Humimicrobiaceae bacterium]|nr:hypothetical protein [Candidatus Humimicrobiaceae bacterium]
MGKKIVTVGGGSGSPVVNEALLRTHKVDYIKAVSAVFDSGGATGRRRLDSKGQEIAYSDAMRILLSLISPKDVDEKYKVIKRWFSHRDAKDTVLGQEIFNRFFGKSNGFSQIEKDLDSLGITLKGTVYLQQPILPILSLGPYQDVVFLVNTFWTVKLCPKTR